MRYFLQGSTLFIRGSFLAASTGVNGGLRRVSTILNHTLASEWDHKEPLRSMERIVSEQGLPLDFFGLLTAVEMRNLCILHYDFITAFITAGVSNPISEPPHTINIIIHSSEGLSEGAILETIITATEAKAQALQLMGYRFTGTTTDEVIVACDGDTHHTYAGTLTEVGRRVYAAVLFGVQEALKRHEGMVYRTEPSLFIHSRYGGSHWVEWSAKDCPYYPCHFQGQSCTFCYCPFYPCKDENLGQWVESSGGGTVWSCSQCTLLHVPEVAAYLKKYPESSLRELRAVREGLQK